MLCNEPELILLSLHDEGRAGTHDGSVSHGCPFVYASSLLLVQPGDVMGGARRYVDVRQPEVPTSAFTQSDFWHHFEGAMTVTPCAMR